MNESVKGEGWLLFAGIMVLIAGILNTIWGIAAIDKASFFLEDDRYIIEDLSTMGWLHPDHRRPPAVRGLLDLERPASSGVGWASGPPA